MPPPDDGSAAARMAANEKAARRVALERRILLFCTVFMLIGLVFWITSMSTAYWNRVDGGKLGVKVPKTGRFLKSSHNGLWSSCRITFDNKTRPIKLIHRCQPLDLFPKNKDYNKTFLDYQRTAAGFSVIALMVMLMGLAFSLYTFFETRYMYKRLAAGCQMVTAGCILICLEVSTARMKYEAHNLPNRIPPGATWTFGFSYILAWITFLSQLTACIAFAICSKKKKKDKAPDDQFAIEEEPTIIGR